ncbi:bacteriohemerythrin [Geomonas limicola]|nr:hemerythrin family protein [Geomonas limicola]
MTAWHDWMATGNEEVDNQHRDLLNKVADLLLACREQRMAEEISKLFWFLKRYVRRHFRDEEKLQLDSGYPGYAAHRAEHQAFYAQVTELEARYLKDGTSTTLIVESLNLMCEWLHRHFRQMDQELVDYLHGVGSYAP